MVALNQLQMPSALGSDASAIQLGKAARQTAGMAGSVVREPLQQVAAQATTKQAETELKERAAGAQQAIQQQAAPLQQQKLEAQKSAADKRLVMSEQQRAMEQQLRSLDERNYYKNYNDVMKFEKDELGRAKWKTQQLMDFAVLQARSDEELRNYSQIVEQAYARKKAIQDHALNLLEQKYKEELTTYDQLEKQALAREQQGLDIYLDNYRVESQFKTTQELNNVINMYRQKVLKDAGDEASERLVGDILINTAAGIVSIYNPIAGQGVKTVLGTVRDIVS